MFKYISAAILGLATLTGTVTASAAGGACCAAAGPSCAAAGCTMPAGKAMPAMPSMPEMAAANANRSVRTYSYEPGTVAPAARSYSPSYSPRYRPSFGSSKSAAWKINQ